MVALQETSGTKSLSKFTMEGSQGSVFSQKQSSQRSLSAYFSEAEDRVMANEILKRLHVLWDKLNPNKTNSERIAAWRSVTDAVNAVGGKSRDVAGVRKRYNHLKAKVKKKASANHIERVKTGGGKANYEELSEIDLIILATIPKDLIEGIENGIDTCKFFKQTVFASEATLTRLIIVFKYFTGAENDVNSRRHLDIEDADEIEGKITIY